MSMKEMGVFDKMRILIYRYHEKGLEIFLIEPKLASDVNAWKLPQSDVEKLHVPAFGFEESDSVIQLEPVQDEHNTTHHTIAVEGDWHDIPSIRGMIKHDFRRVKSKVKEVLPDVEQGAYVAAKDIIKKVLPHEYAAIRELKDILLDRNSVSNI